MKYVIQVCLLLAFTVPAEAQVRIQFDSKARYWGDVTNITIDGLFPKTYYLIKAGVGNDKTYHQSAVVMQSDSYGVIKTNKTPALSGSYTGIDPDGLFWSMRPVTTQVPALAGFHFSVEFNGVTLAMASLPMGNLRPGIQKIPVKEEGLVATLYLPPKTARPQSVVVAYSGSEGGLMTGEYLATALANEGIAALAIAYFNAPGLPKELANIDLVYFERVFRFLAKRKEVDSNKIAVLGPSRGGELSLLLGSLFPQIKAVVALVPSHFRWAGNVDGNPPPPAWKYRGQSFAYLNTVGGLEERRLPDGRIAYANTPAFLKALSGLSSAEIAAVESEIEKTNGPILILGGEDDQVWPSCYLGQLAFQRLKKHNRKFRDEFYCFKNAGHGVTIIPGMPTTDTVIFHPLMNISLLMGGTPEGNGRGQRDAWTKTLEFLRKHL